MTKKGQQQTAFAFGVVFVVVLLILALAVPNPTAFQYTVFRSVLALAAAGVAAMIPGFIEIEVPGWIRAGGALAVFVIVFFYNPAALIVNTDRRLTGRVVNDLVTSLKREACHIRVGVLGAGGEPDRLANDVLIAAQRAGCRTEGVFHGIGFEAFDGIRLQYSAERPPAGSVQALGAAMNAANLAFVPEADPSQPPGSVYVFVGYRPQ